MDFVHIDRVGIELEGAWATRPGAAQNVTFKGDASVLVPGHANNGEAVMTVPVNSWPAVSEWILAAYPTANNESCGLHVHVSVKNRRDYARLMTPAFNEFFLERLHAWGERAALKPHHPFWKRLRGENTRYCAKVFRPDAQAKTRLKDGVRYAQLNYCFKVHGTLEVRVLPMFKQPAIATSAVQAVLGIVEDYLRDKTYTEYVERIDDLG